MCSQCEVHRVSESPWHRARGRPSLRGRAGQAPGEPESLAAAQPGSLPPGPVTVPGQAHWQCQPRRQPARLLTQSEAPGPACQPGRGQCLAIWILDSPGIGSHDFPGRYRDT
jgi:hypothetical protein